MAKEVKYTCDESGKEVFFQGCASLVVLAAQGPDTSEDLNRFSKKSEVIEWVKSNWHHYKHLQVMPKTLCLECLGGYGKGVNINHGDDAAFGIADNVITRLLRKWGLIRNPSAEVQVEA